MSAVLHMNDFLVPSLFKRDDDGSNGNSQIGALIVLNSNSVQVDLLSSIWHSFDTTMCADGGANRLHDGCLWKDNDRRTSIHTASSRGSNNGGSNGSSQDVMLSALIPTHIIGDLDSLRDDVNEYYCNKGTIVLKDSNQDNNDLEKCIEFLSTLYSQEDLLCNTTVVIAGITGGRIDQEIASMHVLFRYLSSFYRIVLVGEESISFLLKPNVTNLIRPINLMLNSDITATNSGMVTEGPMCGLLPIGCKVDRVTTTGLKWNLYEQSLELGKLISSSNQAIMAPCSGCSDSNADADGQNCITVTTSEPLLFSWVTTINNK